jgi:hypothetical protein
VVGGPSVVISQGCTDGCLCIYRSRAAHRKHSTIGQEDVYSSHFFYFIERLDEVWEGGGVA